MGVASTPPSPLVRPRIKNLMGVASNPLPPHLVRPRVKLEKSTNFKALFPAVPTDLCLLVLKQNSVKKTSKGLI